MLNIIADENIAFAKEAFSYFGNVELFNGRNISNRILKNADALIVRSITIVDESLLKSTKVKFVGTATIGTDHVDLSYLKNNGISFADAKGCNAYSVAEYVFTAIMKTAAEKNISLANKSIGIIGAGNVGSKVADFAKAFGLTILKNDPPLQRAGNGKKFVTLNEALQADIVTFHTPLTLEGEDKTYHLLNENNFQLLKENVILLNTSRGAVIDNSALLDFTGKRSINLILDVWENEPSINIELLGKAILGTAHIAGYSLEGKVNGTKMMFDALNKFSGKNLKWIPTTPEIPNDIIATPQSGNLEQKLNSVFKSVYDIEKDDYRMRKMFKLSKPEQAKYFDLLRKEYPFRREFSNYTVLLKNNERYLTDLLKAFRFNVISKA